MREADSVLKGLPNYFEPIRILGEGGMGVVWSVRDTRVNKVGALKVIRRRSEMTSAALMRFDREIRNFAQLIHPYIVQVYDVGQMQTGEPYIFMEQVDGKPICSDMLRGRPFGEIVMLIDRILEGLDEAHANNLIHRDLKPDNILVTEDSEGRLMPKLMDFGLALRADENEMRITCDGMVVGTPIYMAPEQACDEHYQICPATDFYGIGCILYELFCGAPPFTGSNAVMVMVAQAKETPKMFSPLPEFEETKRLTGIIMRLLEKMPDKRYETAADLRAALRRQFLIRDNQSFGVSTLRQESDTAFDERREEDVPFFTSALAPTAYRTILPELRECNYNYSVLALRPPVFVARSSAKYLLTRYLKDVYQCRRTAITMITGRPGVGKSRFLESFAQDCYKQGTATSLVVDGSVCANLRFAVYRALFAKLLLKMLSPQQVILGLCRFMQTDDENDETVLMLNEIYQAECREAQPPLDKMEKIFCKVFSRLTHSRPLILCFDNVAPEQKAELLAIVHELSGNSQFNLPILICVVNATMNGMPTDIELMLGNDNALWLRRSIAVDPLSNSDMHTLVTRSLSISEELAQFIETLSLGHPQIAVNLARQWHLAGFLEPTETGYKANCPVTSLPIPSVVHEAIMRQINLTFADYSRRIWMPVAAVAALYGASFTPKRLGSAIQHLPSNQKLMGYNTFISLGLAGGVLRTVDETTLAYANPLMADAIEATLQPYEMQDYHHAIAQVLLNAKQAHELQGEIAKHLVAAQQFYDAFTVYRSLAEQSAQCSRIEEGLGYVEQCKDVLKKQFGYIDAHTPELMDVWMIEADLYLLRQDERLVRNQVEMLKYSLDELEDPAKRAHYYLICARLAEIEGNSQEASNDLDKAMACLDEIVGEKRRDQLEVQFAVLVARFRYDPSIGQSFVDTARLLKDSVYVGKALLAIASQSVSDGAPDRARRVLDMTVDTAHRNGDKMTEASALWELSRLQKNDPEVRLQTLREAQAGFESIGDFKKLSELHAEMSEVLEQMESEEAGIHAQWSRLLAM